MRFIRCTSALSGSRATAFVMLALALIPLLLQCACTFVPYRVMVMDFDYYSKAPDDQYLATAIPEFLIGTLGNEHICRLLERQDMRTYFTTFKEERTKEGRWNKLKRFGEAIGADYLVLGSVSRLDENYILEARLFSVRDGAVVPGTAVWQSGSSAREIFDKSRYIAKFLAYQLAQQ
jgi:TolB-like protein